MPMLPGISRWADPDRNLNTVFRGDEMKSPRKINFKKDLTADWKTGMMPQ